MVTRRRLRLAFAVVLEHILLAIQEWVRRKRMVNTALEHKQLKEKVWTGAASLPCALLCSRLVAHALHTRSANVNATSRSASRAWTLRSNACCTSCSPGATSFPVPCGTRRHHGVLTCLCLLTMLHRFDIDDDKALSITETRRMFSVLAAYADAEHKPSLASGSSQHLNPQDEEHKRIAIKKLVDILDKDHRCCTRGTAQLLWQVPSYRTLCVHTLTRGD